MSELKANNTHYFKGFNDDYRVGGIYHSLDSSEFKQLIIMQSYSNGNGDFINNDGKGFSDRQLVDIFGLNYRTVKKGLMNLIELGIISYDNDTKIIHLNYFVDDNVYREGSKKSTRARRQMAQTQNDIVNKLDELSSKVDDNIQTKYVDKSTGEILKEG